MLGILIDSFTFKPAVAAVDTTTTITPAEGIIYTFELMMDTLGLPYRILNHQSTVATTTTTTAVPTTTPLEDTAYNYCILIYYGNKTPTELLQQQNSEVRAIIHIPAAGKRKTRSSCKIKLVNSYDKKWLIPINYDFIRPAFDILRTEIITAGSSSDSSKRTRRVLPTKPVVNTYINLLYKLIVTAYNKTSIPMIRKWYWPEGKDFAVCLTHDIDEIRKYTR